MKNYVFLLVYFLLPLSLLSLDVVVKNDNGSPKGHAYSQSNNLYEESAVLQPDGPCTVKKIRIYLSGDQAGIDTFRICGYPTAGNLYPTQYIWPYNQLTPPVAFTYDGTPGWKEFSVESLGLRSDGYDKMVITHILRSNGPWFTYDSDNRQGVSWILDPFTPNPNFYDIIGTLWTYAPGDFMVRLIVEYTYPMDSTSEQPTQPMLTEVTTASGLSGDRNSSVADWNNDGLDDISFSSGLYENNGDGTFKKIGYIANGGTAWADFDNDGYQDIYAIQSGSYDFDHRQEINKNKIYKNNGNSTFTMLTTNNAFLKPYPNPSEDFNLTPKFQNDSMHNPYNTIAPLWFDYNQDGLADLFIANRRMESSQGEIFCPDQLWLNNGDGTFTNTRKAAKIDLGEPFTEGISGLDGYYDCYGAAACDYNNDRKVDLFVANYRLIKDNLYKNNGDGTFEEVGASTGVQGMPTAASNYFGHGMGAQWGDFDNDGLTDLCVGNLAHTDSRGIYSNPSLIFKNKGASAFYKFNEQHYAMGLKFHEGNAGVSWLDFNLDGLLDLWHGKYSGGFGYFYMNQGPPDYKLKDMTWNYGAIVNNSWVGVYLDYDRDGDLDMIVEGRLLRNDIPHEGNWVSFRLAGSPANKICTDAFGTKVSVHCGSDSYYRELMGSSAGSLCTQNSSGLNFGIGKHNTIDSVVIAYPNGETTVLKSVAPNAHYRIPYKEAPVLLGIATPALQSPAHNTSHLPQTTVFKWTNCYSANKYRMQISESKAFSSLLKDTVVSVTELTAGTFKNNTPYYWRVQASNDEKNSAWSSVYTFIVGTALPSAPVPVTPAKDSNLVNVHAKYEWIASTYPCQNCGTTKYQFQLRQSETIDTTVPTVIDLKGIESTSLEPDSSLKPGEWYNWRVRGFNGDTPGDWSEVFKFRTIPLPPQVETIEPADDTTGIPVKAKFRWKSVLYAIRYHLQISADKEFSSNYIDKDNIFDTVYTTTVPKLKEGTDYYWRVSAVNDGGEGLWSETFKLHTAGVSSVNDAISENDINVYPNPAGNSLTIEFYNTTASTMNIAIVDVLGNRVVCMDRTRCSGYDEFSLDLSNLAQGVYYLHFNDGKSSVIKNISIIK